MKRGILIAIIILLLPLVSATVTLTSPTDASSQSSSSITFACSTDESNLTSFELYTTTSDSWAQTTTSATSPISNTVSSLTAGTYTWNCYDGTDWATANYTVRITTAFSGTIANQSWSQGSTKSNAFDLDTYFTNSPQIEVTGNSSITISIDSDNQVSFSAAASYTGSETILFAGYDGNTRIYSNNITLNVTANTAPTLSSNITNQSWDKNTNKTLTLSSYFTDADGDSLNYTSSSPSHITISISSATATLTPDTDWSGSETVTFTATDGTDSTTSNTVTLTVNSTEDAPEITSYSPTSNPTLTPGEEQDFSIDTDDSSDTITWYVDNTEKTTGSSYTFSSEETGTYTIKVEVTDGTETTTRSWTITVDDGSSFDIVSEEVSTDSFLSDQTESGVCGDGTIDAGETCLTCALDVKCEKGYVCETGVCVKNKSGTTIAIFLIGIIVLIGGGIGLYYLFMVKKTPQKPQGNQPFKAKMGKERPPTDYTDFYKKR